MISPKIRDALQRGSTYQRRAFALACADFAIKQLASFGPLFVKGLDHAELRLLQLRAVSAIGTSEAHALDHQLRGEEERLYEEMIALREGDASAPYPEFIRLSSVRHAVCALRAIMFPNAMSAASRTAFEAICATRCEDRIIELATEICAG